MQINDFFLLEAFLDFCASILQWNASPILLNPMHRNGHKVTLLGNGPDHLVQVFSASKSRKEFSQHSRGTLWTFSRRNQVVLALGNNNSEYIQIAYHVRCFTAGVEYR